jgi:hypothetical protein
VTQRPGPNIATSVRQRLLNKARETGRPFSELLQYFAMERFLYRLSKSTHADKFVLKGALMFAAWQAPVARPTMDIDLLGITDNGVDAIVAVARDICVQEVEADRLVFDSGSVGGERIVEDADYGGVRVRFRGKLGMARVTMQLDIGFGDVIVPKPEMTDYPTILDLPASLADIVEAIAVFLGPIVGALAAGERFQGSWKAPGPWRKSSGDDVVKADTWPSIRPNCCWVLSVIQKMSHRRLPGIP